MSGNAKVIIVDDHTLFREGLKMLIELEGIGTVVAEAQNGYEFIRLLSIHSPDIVLLDIEMPQMKGLDAALKAKEIKPDLKILVITMQGHIESYMDMVNAGVMGFVLKTAEKQELQKAITSVLAGQQYFCNEILQNVVNDFIEKSNNIAFQGSNEFILTNKELEVLRYLCEGLTVTEVAEKIYRSVKTVEAHRAKLLEKTNTKNTINLILYAIKNRLVKV